MKHTLMPTALILDDEEISRFSMRIALEELGWSVVACSNANQLFTLLEEGIQDISVFLIDIMMPDISGLSVISALKGSSIYSDKPILIVSGRVRTIEVDHILSLGANEFMSKPVSIENLDRTLKKFHKPFSLP